MALNVEVKARVRDLQYLRRRLERVAEAPPECLEQEDTFFGVARGRLKLRCDPSGKCDLIYYRRQDEPGPTISAYFREQLEDPFAKYQELSNLFGSGRVIRKKRFLYCVSGARVHVDEVEGLGDFLEIEVPLASAEDTHRAKAAARQLMQLLGISIDDLFGGAYEGLFEQAPSDTESTPAVSYYIRHEE